MGETTPSPKKIKPIYITIGLVASVIMALIITIIVAIVLINKPIPNVHAPEDVYTQMVPLREFIVNLLDMGGRRYLKVQIDFEVELDKKPKKSAEAGTTEIPSEMKAKESVLRNYIINILSNTSTSEIRSIEGKNNLRKAILVKSNFILKRTKVLNVYFNDFIIQ
jgi:flagellar basal body-associated protein FliL